MVARVLGLGTWLFVVGEYLNHGLMVFQYNLTHGLDWWYVNCVTRSGMDWSSSFMLQIFKKTWHDPLF